MRVAIHQPNYLPWIGYFHKIANVDKFVFFDDIQLTRGKSFSTRVKIIINGDESWLSVPVLGKSEKQLIKDVKVNNSINWQKKHLKTIKLNYSKAKFFDHYFRDIENILMQNSNFLIDYNIPLIEIISSKIGLKTQFLKSSELMQNELDTTNKILEINALTKASVYYTGKGEGSKRFIRDEDFQNNDIKLEWQDFNPIEYNQLNTEQFVPYLSIIDLLFNEGPNTIKMLKTKNI